MRPSNYRILLNELVSVNFNDQVLGSISKWAAHQNSYISQSDSLPHRAFSIFLFNSQNKLLLQRRSSDKKTFPLCWTNTCCSHPNMIEYQNKTEKGVQNIRDSLHRALDRQLKMNLKTEKFYLVDKILYKALGKQEQKFGQYEVDYVYLCKVDSKNIPFTMVPEQICQTAWVSRQKLDEFIKEKQQKQKCSFTPWFMKMYSNKLMQKWWDVAMSNNLKDVDTEQKLRVKSL